MKALEKIKESSQAIVKICQKERLSKADKERLFKLQGDIFSQIDSLTECEICGRVSDLIASITIANTKGGDVINQSSNTYQSGEPNSDHTETTQKILTTAIA